MTQNKQLEALYSGAIVVLAYDNAETLDIAGPLDILGAAPCVGSDFFDFSKRTSGFSKRNNAL